MITLEEVKELFESIEAMPSKPDYQQFPVYVITDTIDENETVKWNREEIKRRMQAREDERQRLLALKHARTDQAHKLVIKFIAQETGLDDHRCAVLWDFVLSTYQDRRIDVWARLKGQIDLYNALK